MILENSLDDLDLFPDRPAQEKLQALRKEIYTHLTTSKGAPPRAMVLETSPVKYEPYVFLRGNPNNRGTAVTSHVPMLFAPFSTAVPSATDGRLQLAQAVVSPQNPLTPRVLVNRVWLLHFGSALVRTPGDFGIRSAPPTHPELLDYLASEFVAHGWSIKWLHRTLLLSETYRQSSEIRPQATAIDPENLLLWRMNRRRLDFEALRDSALLVSGSLDETRGGPSVDLLTAPFSRRRTMYGVIDRQALPGLYRTFDFPSPDATSSHREQTTVAPQALFLMNHPQILELSQRLLTSAEVTSASSVEGKVQALYRRVLGRSATSEESTRCTEFLKSAGDSPATWKQFAHLLLLTNEFAYVD